MNNSAETTPSFEKQQHPLTEWYGGRVIVKHEVEPLHDQEYDQA